MGWDRHHAIIVTGFDHERVANAHRYAVDTGATVTDLILSPLNNWESFVVMPDGSKEGWADSDLGDRRRATIVEYLRQPDNWLDWVEVQYGDDAKETVIIAHSDEEVTQS